MRIKIRYGNILSGVAIHQTPVLKVNFTEDATAYSHMLFTVNGLAYPKIDHVYGVLTGLHVGESRSEATIAVLVGNYSIKAEVEASEKNEEPQLRGINFDADVYREFEVGKADFFDLDSGDPAKLATFIAGHYNRYISPPAHPNLEMQSRFSKYRLPYFKAACYAGLHYNKALTSTALNNGAKAAREVQLEIEKKLFLEALEEAFQHGFCDPLPQLNGSRSDRPLPTEDVGLLLTEMRAGGSMERLVNEVLTLSDRWRRPQIRMVYEGVRTQNPELPFG